MNPTSLRPRIFAAWLLLVCAVLLFGFTVSFAQSNKKDTKGKVTIRIQKDEDGKKTKIDTTITEDQLPALKEYLKDLDIDFDASGNWSRGSGSGNGSFHFRHPEMSKADREKLREEMKSLKKDLKNLDKELSEMHIEIHGFDDGDPENFDFNFTLPPLPEMPELPEAKGFYFHYGDDDDQDGNREPGKSFKYRYHSDEDIPENYRGKDHLIIRGKKGEEKPELETVIDGKDGEKIFIYKRKLPKEEAKVKSGMAIQKVKVYPNPGDGKITVNFNSPSEGDVQLEITDATGKNVFSKSLKNFSGDYSESVDLTASGKGTYFLKITQGDDSISKKILVE